MVHKDTQLQIDSIVSEKKKLKAVQKLSKKEAQALTEKGASFASNRPTIHGLSDEACVGIYEEIDSGETGAAPAGSGKPGKPKPPNKENEDPNKAKEGAKVDRAQQASKKLQTTNSLVYLVKKGVITYLYMI